MTKDHRIGVVDRLRIENAVLSYDFWLEVRGVRGRDRRGLRRELRGNLASAAAEVGVTQALHRLGPIQQLAVAATEDTYVERPLWSRGMVAAAIAFAVMTAALLYTATAFTAGVDAAGVTGRTVRGGVLPWFGVDYSARVDPDRGAFSTGAGNAGFYLLGLPLLAFVVVSRPWRMLTSRRDRTT